MYGSEKSYAPSVTLQGARSSYHPLNASLIVIWIILVVAEIVLLERSVAVAPTATKLPWYYSITGLPSVLNVVFAQGHGMVTAMYLSRLFVSALASHRATPRTWIEMFWVANQNWSGPLGILITTFKMGKLRIRVSTSFIMFAFVSMVALVTPIVLDQAYPVKTLDVRVNVTFTPSVLSPDKLLGIDAYGQLAAGRGSWTTNQSVLNVFNSTSFTPVGAARDSDTSDLFFSGDVRGIDVARLPGIRIQGGCQPVTTDGLPDLNNFTVFMQYCKENLNGASPSGSASKTLAASSLSLNVSYCSTVDFDSRPVPSNSTLLAWFTNSTFTGTLTSTVRELVRCEARTTMGNAHVYGRALTFDNFEQDDGLYNTSQAHGGEPIQEPLFGALYALLDSASASSAVSGAQVIDMLGFREVMVQNHGLAYVPPLVGGLADAVWRGATHMTVAVALLSRDDTTSYDGVDHVAVSGRTRNWPAFVATMALLAVWLFCLFVLTLALWRQTSLGSSFDSYVAGRLLAQRPDLVEGDCSGSLEDNPRLLERFVIS